MDKLCYVVTKSRGLDSSTLLQPKLHCCFTS